MIPEVPRFQVDIKERGGGSDTVNVQMALSGEQVNMSMVISLGFFYLGT